MRFLFLFVILLTLQLVIGGEDYYEILGIGKDADNRQIRKAFKKLALKYHPDKNDDEDAQEKFLKINKAYETLKDEEKRKRYDRFGEESDEDQNNRHQGAYQSWSYYHDDFGLYDEDPEIVTLDYHDFRRSVSDSYNYWFINFYSPQCGHCHELAPTWRKVSKMLNGIVRIGAVNCQDDPILCRTQNIRAYPTLIFFGPEGKRVFQGPSELEDLVQFVIDQIPDHTVRLRTANIQKVVKDAEDDLPDFPWVIMFCIDDDFKCPEKQNRQLLSKLVSGLVNIGYVDCAANKKLCNQHTGGEDNYGTFYYSHKKNVLAEEPKNTRLSTTEVQDLAQEILKLLPEVKTLDEEEYSKIRLKLEDRAGPAWLIHFVFGDDGKSIEEKRIPSMITGIKYGRIDCKEQPETCREVKVNKPMYICFKIGGGFEVHFGRDLPNDIIEFARNSAQAKTMITLTASDFPDILDKNGVFIDFFAPWCPPCLNLLPEYRKASMIVGGSIVFGTIDCTTQAKICEQFNIRSYPTTVFFNNSKAHYYQGEHSAQSLADFVYEILRPSVKNLDYYEFHRLVVGRPENEVWAVDFYAPWCGPCMQLAPQWTKMAQLLKKVPEIKIAKVDCTVEERLCHEQAIRGYPSIRMYPMNSGRTGKYFVYTGFHRDAHSLKEWVLESLPTFVENLTPYTFGQKVSGSSRPAIVYFYTPWCGYCQQFSPSFDGIALEVRSKVLAGKINCERFPQLCRHQAIRAYPTVRYYPGNTDRGEELVSRDPDNILDYIYDRLEMASENMIVHDEL